MRIAVAEDEPDVRDYFQRILPQMGHDVVGVAADGLQLVELCRTQQPDLVITDLRMPLLDGDQAMRLVWDERVMPCIFISAYSKPVPFADADGRAGCVFLTKPVNREELAGAIRQVALSGSDCKQG